MKHTFYLFESSVQSHYNVMLPEKFEGEHPFEEVPLREPNENIRVFLQRNVRGRPGWINFFEAHCDFGTQPLWNQHNSLVITIRIDDGNETRFFALPAGFGFISLDRNQIEDDFGITVTMNTVHDQKLRGVETRDITSRTQQKKLLATYDGSVWQFPVDPDLEVFGKMAGTPSDDEFAAHVSGSDSLSLLKDLHWNQLEELCRLLLQKYKSRDFEQRFQFATLQRKVRAKTRIERLDDILSSALRDRVRDKISLALPIADIDRVAESALHTGRGSDISLTPLSIDNLYAAFHRAHIETPDPRRLTLLHWDADGAPVDAKNLYKHLLFETRVIEDHGVERVYVFSLGSWYVVSSGHVEEVERRLESIPLSEYDELLPPLNWSARPDGTYRLEREDEYNARLANDAGLALFDKIFFTQNLPPRSKIEVCDLLDSEGRFICVKKYESSSDLSHLFAQGTVSAELFFHMAEYRRFTRDQIRGQWTCPFDPENDRPTDLKLVFAIACPVNFRVPQDLPFFSKVNLLKAARTARPFGFQVEVAKIPIASAPPAAPRPRRRKQPIPAAV